ncbi:hypothetical protein OF83DRAFT_1093390 [Amylostereum chailletii]|nr:hypothetical protein OF83DRAFT_1093390 [Amylostereum chailletii]
MPNHHNPPGYYHVQRQQTLAHSVTFGPLPPHQGSPDLPRYTHPSSTSPYASQYRYQT